jgi:hypothetical protein
MGLNDGCKDAFPMGHSYHMWWKMANRYPYVVLLLSGQEAQGFFQ